MMEWTARLRSERFMLAIFLALVMVLALGPVPVRATNDVPASQAMGQDTEAKAILMKMADFLAKAQAFSVTVRSSYDAIQEDGQRIEFGETYRILIQRPDHLRVDNMRSDGEHGQLIFDGKTITVFKADDNVFASVEQPGTVDNAVVYLVRDLQITLPLARMFRTNFPQDLEKQVASVSYVEEDTLFDVPTDHLAARAADVDVQVWIARGEPPLPRRVILTYKKASGQPQFRADFSEWAISPAIADGSFTFTPPKNAEKIPFVAPERQKGSLPVRKGGEQ
jgi:hypothetical protein